MIFLVMYNMFNDMCKNTWLSIKRYFWQLARITKTEKAISSFYHLFLDTFIYGERPFWFEVKTIEVYCTYKNEVMTEIESSQNRPVYEPAFFELSSEKEYQFLSPSIYVAIMHNVMAIGATGLILAGDIALCDAIKYDKEHHINFRYGPIVKVEADRVQVKVRRKVKEIECAINLCGLASFNYYHFTMEIISRLGYVNCFPDMESMPVLIDEDIKAYYQLEEFVRIMNPNREIIYVPKGGRIQVNLLIQPSMNTWMPINTVEKNFHLSDNLIAQSGIMNIRAGVNQYIKPQTTKKIYISRKNCHAIRLVNEFEIIPIFEAAGFDIIYTESMSYIEQVKLFSSAKCVVAPTGASLTNVIYCHSGTVLGCIIPQEYNFCIYSTLAHYIGGKTLFLNPEIIFRGGTIGEDQYQIKPEVCRRYVEKLVEMCD